MQCRGPNAVNFGIPHVPLYGLAAGREIQNLPPSPNICVSRQNSKHLCLTFVRLNYQKPTKLQPIHSALPSSIFITSPYPLTYLYMFCRRVLFIIPWDSKTSLTTSVCFLPLRLGVSFIGGSVSQSLTRQFNIYRLLTTIQLFVRHVVSDYLSPPGPALLSVGCSINSNGPAVQLIR